MTDYFTHLPRLFSVAQLKVLLYLLGVQILLEYDSICSYEKGVADLDEEEFRVVHVQNANFDLCITLAENMTLHDKLN